MFIYRFRLVVQSFLGHADLPFARALSEEAIQQAFDSEGVVFGQDARSVYTPALTLWAFLSQVLFKGEQRSCVAAVSRVVVLVVALGRERCSDNTGAYCRARAKLPVVVLRRLTQEVAARCEEQLPGAWLWKGRHVHLVDGTTVSMPDTPANQADYPQPTSQEPGLGFPLARMVVLFSLASAMISDMAIGPVAGKETGETALLREGWDRFGPGDILLADRYYCSYFMIALLRERGVDFVVRLHASRQADFRRGTRLGKGDHVVEWRRPSIIRSIDWQTLKSLPEFLTVRETRVQVEQPGFRSRTIIVVTTLLDAEEITKDDLAELYRARWNAELDLRSLKQTMQMDILRCKTPELVRKEIWTHILAYNLIRTIITEAASKYDVEPRSISFKGAIQTLEAFQPLIAIQGERDSAFRQTLYQQLLDAIATHRVADRPDRFEPRLRKRRQKKYDRMMKPRHEIKRDILNGLSEN